MTSSVERHVKPYSTLAHLITTPCGADSTLAARCKTIPNVEGLYPFPHLTDSPLMAFGHICGNLFFFSFCITTRDYGDS